MQVILFQIEKVWLYKTGPEGMPITKGLPYEIFMKKIIRQLKETGQLNQLLKKYSVSEPNCSPLYKEGKSLSLEKMISLFIISVIGILLGCIILITEKLCHIYKPMKNVSVKESNKMKLQRLFLKLQENLNDDEVFLPSTMTTLIEDMQQHNILLKDNNNFTGVVRDGMIKNWSKILPPYPKT